MYQFAPRMLDYVSISGSCARALLTRLSRARGITAIGKNGVFRNDRGYFENASCFDNAFGDRGRSYQSTYLGYAVYISALITAGVIAAVQWKQSAERVRHYEYPIDASSENLLSPSSEFTTLHFAGRARRPARYAMFIHRSSDLPLGIVSIARII